MNLLLWIHITAGACCLITGCIAIMSRKGRRGHRRAGNIFSLAMLVLSLTALAISAYKFNRFLFSIAIFSQYLTYQGYRAVQNKSLYPNSLDWAVLVISVANSFMMIYSGNIVLVTYGILSSISTLTDIRSNLQLIKKEPLPKLEWIRRHISSMLGAYIAVLTAFLVVNTRGFQPYWLPWLFPSFIGIPVMIFYLKKYAARSGAKFYNKYDTSHRNR